MTNDRLSRLLAANADFTATFDRGELRAPPREKLAILTCMDCRIAVEELFGLEVGDVAVVRNAGAVASDDAIRSLLLTRHVLGTSEIVVMGHTGCGLVAPRRMQVLREATGRANSGSPARQLFGSFDDLEDPPSASRSLRIRCPPVAGRRPRLHGLVYEVETGRAASSSTEPLAGSNPQGVRDQSGSLRRGSSVVEQGTHKPLVVVQIRPPLPTSERDMALWPNAAHTGGLPRHSPCTDRTPLC